MKTRVVTGIFLITLASFALFYSSTTQIALALIISVGVLSELIKMANLDIKDILITLLVTGILADATLLNTPSFWSSTTGVLISGTFLALLVTELVRKKPYFSNIKLLFGIRSGLLALILFSNLSSLFSSPWLSLLVLTCIWATDSGAYFTGKLIGKRKLSSLSPNKTIEGSLGGLVLGSILFSAIATYFNLISGSLLFILPLGILLSLLSQIGDLHESMIKRFYQVKDSSNILPGHGGIYDRCDSYIFTVPFFVVVNLFIL